MQQFYVWKLFDRVLAPFEQSYVELAAFLGLCILATAAMLVRRRRQVWRFVIQAVSLIVFFLVVSSCLGVFGLIRNAFLGLRLLSEQDDLSAFYWMSMTMVAVGAAFVGGAVFCGWICPLGTLIDAADWLARPIHRLRKIAENTSRKNHLQKSLESPVSTPKSKSQNLKSLRYGILVAVLVSSIFGVLLSGFFSAIPVLTRGMMFTAGRLQLGLMKNWAQLRPESWTFHLSVALFAAVFLLTVFGRRFWCRHLCPTGAMFSAASLLRLTERKVEGRCSQCGRCVEVCSFGAIEPDFSTRPTECAFCQTCARACLSAAIRFPMRPIVAERATMTRRVGAPPLLSRRGFVLSAAGGAAFALAVRSGLADGFHPRAKLLRPPGSVPEDQFLDLCIRCGECFKVCPGPVLHPAGLEGGIEALWTPVVVPTHAGCHQDCNFCTLVCPTRAIRPLPIEVKRKTRMGLAVIKPGLCLPHRGERDCQLCYDECKAAGYHAIEMREITIDTGKIPAGIFSEEELDRMSRIRAPFVDREKCVGCGLCEYRCHTALVKQQKILPERAVVTLPENEDR
ncbi:MAG: 4Fe-4S binding protein [Candidatus Sumerlaeia bacterium]|nr:4Fe-4S binding protein [Candidatus Sumerlaeia bacterium]